MAFLSEENQNDIRQIFEELDGDVRLELYTQHDSLLIVPGVDDCATCKETRQLLDEVVALSDKLHLEVHEIPANGELAAEHNIHRLPALVMTAEGVNGKVRYFGLPSGYEFSVLIGSIVDVSNAQSGLADETIEVLNGLDKDLHIQVFVTPT